MHDIYNCVVGLAWSFAMPPSKALNHFFMQLNSRNFAGALVERNIYRNAMTFFLPFMICC